MPARGIKPILDTIKYLSGTWKGIFTICFCVTASLVYFLYDDFAQMRQATVQAKEVTEEANEASEEAHEVDDRVDTLYVLIDDLRHELHHERYDRKHAEKALKREISLLRKIVMQYAYITKDELDAKDSLNTRIYQTNPGTVYLFIDSLLQVGYYDAGERIFYYKYNGKVLKP